MAETLPFNENDIFRGFFAEDVERLSRLLPAPALPVEGLYIDALGVRVDPSYCPWVADRKGTVCTDLPFPTDGYIGDAVEYASLAIAVDACIGKESVVFVELGSGWGPWTTAFVALARNAGIGNISIAAVEASPLRFAHLRKHLALNGIVSALAPDDGFDEGLRWKLICGAVSVDDGTLYWPNIDSEHDSGNAAVENVSQSSDYRGIETSFRAVRASGLASLLGTDVKTDFLHIDIQGNELALVSGCIDFLTENVRFLFIGTHSRKIEGDLMDILYSHGWILLREKPCRFYSMLNSLELRGKTYFDGAQCWRNMKLL